MSSLDAEQGMEVRQLLARLSSRAVLCVGDIMLDKYVNCEAGRISPEAPVIAFAEASRWTRPGGVGNVAVNVAALGCKTICIAATGADPEGDILATSLDRHEIEYWFSNRDPERQTTRKTRFVAGGQQLLRVDRETILPLDNDTIDEILGAVRDRFFDVLIVSDYGKGVVTPYMMQTCHSLARYHDAKLIVDPKGTDWAKYGPAYLIKPNTAELQAATGLPCRTDAEVEAALASALANSSAHAILVTRGGDGASIMRRGDSGATHYRTSKVAVSDVCGAGDTNLAALGSLLAAGADLDIAARFAQLASSLAVQRQGNAVISNDDIQRALSRDDAPMPSEYKITNIETIAELAEHWRSNHLRVGFTNGCFDILHPGHIRVLETARAHCDRLVVGMNSDASVKRLKGRSRPIIKEEDRARVLAGLHMVDAVVPFSQDTPEKLIRAIRPDVLVKGGDYTPAQVVGASFVEGAGGQVIIAQLIDGHSTSKIVREIGNLSRPSKGAAKPSRSLIEKPVASPDPLKHHEAQNDL